MPCPTLSGMHTNTWGPYKLLSTILSCCNEISARWTSLLHHFFTLIFRVSLNSALCRLIIFISTKRCGILSFLTHYPVHISIDIQHDTFPHWDLMFFQNVPFIFLSSVLRWHKLMAFCNLCNAAYSPIGVSILLKQLSYQLVKHNNWVHIQLDLMKKCSYFTKWRVT